MRLAIADRALGRHVDVDDPRLGQAAELALDAVGRLELAGRPLASATAAEPVPGPAHLAPWHACTVLREHRGLGHVAALVAAGVGPLEAYALVVDAGVTPAEVIMATRSWTSAQWEHAVAAAVSVFSTTTGLASMAMAVAHTRGLFELDEPVATSWPEFAREGKHDFRVGCLLTHRAGWRSVG